MHTKTYTTKTNNQKSILKYLFAAALFANICIAHCAADNDAWTLIPHDAEISDSLAYAAYEHYAHELRDRSKEELNDLLSRVSDGATFNRSKIIALVHADADPNFRRSRTENSSLMRAIWKSDYGLARFLCKRGADPNRNDFLEYPTFWSCEDTTMLDLLVSFGANIHITSGNNKNILYRVHHHSLTSKSDPTALVLHMLKLGASIKQVDSTGYTPLINLVVLMTIYNDKYAKTFLEIAHLFLAAGVETQHRIKWGDNYNTAADMLRHKEQNESWAKDICKKTYLELARTIERYPLRSLQELIIRNAILDVHATDPKISEPAQELVALLQAQDTTLHTNNKEIFERCFDELTPRERPKSIIVSLHSAFGCHSDWTLGPVV